MMSEWKQVKLGELLLRSKIPVDIQNDVYYRRVTIRTKHNGVSLRDIVLGKKIGTKKQFVLKRGQFVMSKIDARYGAFGIASNDVDDSIITGNFWAYDINQELTTVDWVNSYTNSREFYNLCERASSGITHRKYLNEVSFLNHSLFIPPIAMQSAILKRLNSSASLITNLFSQLTQQEKYLKKLRQTILQEAIEGRLTADWRAKNPVIKGDPNTDAQALLVQTQTEKERLIAKGEVKAAKKQESIVDENISEIIPTSWAYPHLDEITAKITDGTHQTPLYVGKGKMFLSAQNVKPFKFMPEVHKLVSEEAYAEYTKTTKAELGDLLVARVGAVGETAVVNKELDFAIYVSLGLIKPIKQKINSNYICIVFNSPYGVRYAKGNVSSLGSSAGNFNLGRIRTFNVPLPSTAEQAAIVEKVQYLFTQVDALETELKSRRVQTELLMQAVLAEAFSPSL